MDTLESEWGEVMALRKGGVQMKGRKWTAEAKLAIVLEGIKGVNPVADLPAATQGFTGSTGSFRRTTISGGIGSWKEVNAP
jgi:hypothetical protein